MKQGAGAPIFPIHFDGKRFFNPGAAGAPGFFAALRWMVSSRPERSARFVSDVEQTKPPARVEGAQLRVTLVNHSTVLLQQNGLHILTDPIWAERASPVAAIGPRRRRKPGVRWEDVPRIDVVLLSHNHYDHLDLAALRRLADRGESAVCGSGGSGEAAAITEDRSGARIGLGQGGLDRAGADSQRAGAAFFGARNRSTGIGRYGADM